MDDVTADSGRKRGLSASRMRAFTCKDCQREVEHLEEQLARLEQRGASKQEIKKVRAELTARREKATYNENWAKNLTERGGSRSDRCKEHRQKHRINIQGMAVAYIDLQTIGEVADRRTPPGRSAASARCRRARDRRRDQSTFKFGFGMTDAHVTKILELLLEKQVLVLKAGTGTGSRRTCPYRLMDPPAESPRNRRLAVRQAHRSRPDHRDRAARAGDHRRRRLRRRDHVGRGRRRPRLPCRLPGQRATAATTRRASSSTSPTAR